MNPPAFTLDVVIKYLFKSVKRDSRSKFLFKSGDVFSYQRSKNQPTNKQELALRICENTCTEDLSSSDFWIHENENHLEVRRCGCASSLQEPFNADLRETFEGYVTSVADVFVDKGSSKKRNWYFFRNNP